MKKSDNFSITNKTKSKPKSLLFVRIKNDVLGKDFELSLVFIGSTKSRAFNKEYRKKDKPTNILTFPLSKTEGEIFITPEVAKRDAKKFDMKENDFIVYLFIHGLLHLNGLKHGDKMDKEEEKLKKKYI
ncbi:rRNA maturation RNase YbeY [bacterium]|jgi:probable rRNA maturation factor|nr:rRNA maturation RNase YbeY [bacterium]MBT3729999.1 rRNA maturation RNase YbeY [bacterium]MBT4894543.1 rRNA maturation RNase YbeY [bacterium]